MATPPIATFSGQNSTAHLLSEGCGSYSRDEIIIKSGSGIVYSGTPLGRITAAGATQGQYAPYNNAATDGTQAVAGILWQDVDATSAAARGVAHVRQCEVVASRLVWPVGTSGADKTAGLSDMATIGIIPR